MIIDFSFKVLESILLAKHYESREEVLSAAKLVMDVVCGAGHLTPAVILNFKSAYEKLASLNFDEMKELIQIMKGTEDEDAQNAAQHDGTQEESESLPSKPDYGEREYATAMEYYEQQDYCGASLFFRAAAKKGNARAEYNYALCLYKGQGTRQNKVEAIKCFVNASACGITQADQMLRFIAEGNE